MFPFVKICLSNSVIWFFQSISFFLWHFQSCKCSLLGFHFSSFIYCKQTSNFFQNLRFTSCSASFHSILFRCFFLILFNALFVLITYVDLNVSFPLQKKFVPLSLCLSVVWLSLPTKLLFAYSYCMSLCVKIFLLFSL